VKTYHALLCIGVVVVMRAPFLNLFSLEAFGFPGKESRRVVSRYSLLRSVVVPWRCPNGLVTWLILPVTYACLKD
jgi:hypothetical protein